jgi:hypothetical protein
MGEIADKIIGLTAARRANAAIIETEFKAAGYTGALAAAAMVNSLAESALNERAVGDNGASIGLFQMNRVGGAGRGHSVEELMDPTSNVRILLKVEKRALDKIQAAVKAGAGIAEAAGLFAQYVERPRDTLGEKARRAASTARYFPAAALSAIESGASGVISKVAFPLGAAVFAVAGGVGVVFAIRQVKKRKAKAL